MDPSPVIDDCMDMVAMATNALHQIDQVRRDMYKTVPSSLKGYLPPHWGSFGVVWGQKVIVVSNELAQSLVEKPTTSYTQSHTPIWPVKLPKP